jgi:hypothetical protein
MTTETMTIQVPESLYRRLERLAALSGRPLDSLIAQTLSASIPPLPDDLPAPMRDALTSLEGLSDDDLWQIVRSGMREAEYEQFIELRAKRRAGTIAPDEQVTLDHLTQEANLLTLRKAYAAVLLKWRGHRLPNLADLEAQP